jgi:hypothetical protein
MHRFLIIILSVFAAPLILSCTTVSGIQAEKPPVRKLFSDWEYKGFGRVLPPWAELYFTGGTEKVRTLCPECTDREILIVCASGKNADQAEQSLIEKTTNEPVSEGYVLKESVWVCLGNAETITEYGGDTYVALSLYVK